MADQALLGKVILQLVELPGGALISLHSVRPVQRQLPPMLRHVVWQNSKNTLVQCVRHLPQTCKDSRAAQTRSSSLIFAGCERTI